MDCQFVGSFYDYAQLPKDKRPQIAFAGRSNVGKSSLLNKITGHKKLAKVSRTPGKTRSLNFYLVNDRFYFVDLPGYGYARVAKAERGRWAKLLEEYLYLQRSERLIGLVILMDSRREPSELDHQLLSWLNERELPAIAIVTKADKLNRDKMNRRVKQIENEFGLQAIPFSIITGVGKREIHQAVLDLVAEHNQ